MNRQVIKVEAKILRSAIDQKKSDIEKLESTLRRIQDLCNHEGFKMYRDHQTGTCSICLKDFLSKTQIDAIYTD